MKTRFTTIFVIENNDITIIFNDVIVSQDQDIEKELLIKLMKTQSSLQSKLISTTTELESLKEKLAITIFHV